MSDEKTDNTDEPTKAELHDRVRKLESTVEKLMPSRRDALKFGAAGIAGAAGLSATTQPADAATGSSGQIGDPNNRPDLFADTVDANNVVGAIQGCRVFLSSDQSISAGAAFKIKFDSKVYDSDNNFDTSSHNWTCPADGLYMVNLQVSFTSGSAGDKRDLRIGTGTDSTTVDQGGLIDSADQSSSPRFQAATINRYSSGDTIAGHTKNDDSSDTLESGASSFQTFLEVAFLGEV